LKCTLYAVYESLPKGWRNSAYL